MGKLMNMLSIGKEFLASHGAETTSVIAGIGVAVTGYFAFKAGFDTCAELSEMPEDISSKEKIAVVVKNSWEAITSSVLTWSMIATSGIISYRRNKALGAMTLAYESTSEMYHMYRRHALERLGEKKEGEMRGDIAREQLEKHCKSEDDIFNTGHGNTLFIDGLTGNCFRSSLDYIRKRQTELNHWFSAGEDCIDYTVWASNNDIPYTDNLKIFVWTAEHPIDFDLDATVYNDEPAFLLNYDACCPGNEMQTLYDFRAYS